MTDALERIKNTKNLTLPKRTNPRDALESSFGVIAGETERAWLLACSHRFFPPASEAEITDAQEALGQPLPAGYIAFLRKTNGARLFCVPIRDSSSTYVRFPVFSCAELVEANKNLLDTFRASYLGDPEFGRCDHLNYVAFCDAEDGDFQAAITEGSKQGIVFLLFHEFLYRPYDDADAEFSPILADSFDTWLEQIAETGGWGGRGPSKSRQ